jgi:hypothetical protein
LAEVTLLGNPTRQVRASLNGAVDLSTSTSSDPFSANFSKSSPDGRVQVGAFQNSAFGGDSEHWNFSFDWGWHATANLADPPIDFTVTIDAMASSNFTIRTTQHVIMTLLVTPVDDYRPVFVYGTKNDNSGASYAVSFNGRGEAPLWSDYNYTVTINPNVMWSPTSDKPPFGKNTSWVRTGTISVKVDPYPFYVEDVARLASGQAKVRLHGTPFTEYTIERSALLADDWQSIGTVTTDFTGAAEYTELTASGLPCAYYRASR